MNEKITIRIERPMWGNGQMGTGYVERRLDPMLLEDAVDPGGFIIQIIGYMMNDLDRRQAEILAADKKAREEGRL
jgi:hypothetical protein